ncbi:molybdopterin-dependent oxidoreductase [Campylobacter lari]
MALARRNFLKLAGIAGLGSTAFGSENKAIRAASEQEVANPYPDSKIVRTICSICSAGCGIKAEVQDGVWVRQENAIEHPISQGSHCCKGIDQIDLTKSKQRIKYPMKKENGKWVRLTWEQAINEIGDRMLEIRKENGPDSVMFLGSAKFNNQQAYYFRKFAAFWGTNNIDHVARI